jgi:hypothetical protein
MLFEATDKFPYAMPITVQVLDQQSAMVEVDDRER